MTINEYHHRKCYCVVGYVMSILCEALRAKVKNYLTSIFYPNTSKPIWLMVFVQMLKEIQNMLNGSS